MSMSTSIVVDAMKWEQLVRGAACPFDAPRADSNDHWDFVARMAASSLYLAKNQSYRGQCLLIFDLRHATRPDQLSQSEWAAFCTDLYIAEKAVLRVVRPDHINVALLGNVIPHLHWHIVPRYVSDPRWGAPIWPTVLADMPDLRLSSNEHLQLIRALRDALSG
jgi:diadenosine tetraphosphate (Ap4A) HIT family hydrolase